MQRFKKYLLRRIDHHGIQYPSEMCDMTFNRNLCLNVHLLSGSVWPSAYFVQKYKVFLPHFA